MSTRAVTIAIWLVLVAAGLSLGLLGELGRWRFIRLEEFAEAVLSPRWARAVIFVGWAWLGWHVFAR